MQGSAFVRELEERRRGPEQGEILPKQGHVAREPRTEEPFVSIVAKCFHVSICFPWIEQIS